MKNQSNKFPFVKLGLGSLIGSVLSYANSVKIVQDTVIYPVNFIVIFGFSLFFASIPMFIAYSRKVKKRELIYWITFCGMFLPFGVIFLLVSFLMSLFMEKESIDNERKEEEFNTPHQNA